MGVHINIYVYIMFSWIQVYFILLFCI